jgi:Uma2 family endonuclease
LEVHAVEEGFMSVANRPTVDEPRIRIPGVGFHVYETLVRALPERTAIRVAYDGRDMEIMVKGPIHNDYARIIDRFVTVVAALMSIPHRGLGETTWIRPEIERGLEADQCYVFERAKLARLRDLLARKDNDVAGYPNPDLAIEVDLSPPQTDRPSIYAALQVPELWVFDGEILVIQHLSADGKYLDIGASQFLPVSADQVMRWVRNEDTEDMAAWEERLRAWATTELAGRRPN